MIVQETRPLYIAPPNEASLAQLSQWLKLKLNEVPANTPGEYVNDLEDLTINTNRTGSMKVSDSKVLNTIRTLLFEDLGIEKPNDIVRDRSTLKRIESPYPGDIFVIDYPINNNRDIMYRKYAIVTTVKENGDIFTYPPTNSIDISYTKAVLRYDILDNFNAVLKIKQMNADAELNRGIAGPPSPRNDIRIPTAISEPPGLLQIGDIKFLVSPTQISFTTQNGYQNFPTVRTKGNPKLPSLQEAKSMNFSLIFPNIHTINNQLLPLFAMFRRTPFVNIYNKDISAFYSTIRNPESKFVPVALESISIESVTGYPNTLQANITVLPFQHKAVGETFEALKTFDDVANQQFLNKDISVERITNQIDARLQNKEFTPHTRELVGNPILASDNFEESEPFRSFYQSLIAERDFVENDLGQIVSKQDGAAIPLSKFRPKLDENKLHYYSSTANKNKVLFKYKYIPEDFREFTEDLNNLRREELSRMSSEVSDMLKIINDGDSPKFKAMINRAFVNRETFYSQISNQFKRADRFIHDFLIVHGIDIKREPSPQITNILELLLEVGAHKFPGTAFVFGTGRGVISTTANLIKSVQDGNYTLEGTDRNQILNVLNGIMTWYEGPDEINPLGPVDAATLADLITDQVLRYVNTVSDKVEEGQLKSEKEKWAHFFDRFFRSFVDPSIIRSLTTDFAMTSFNTQTDIIEIDNEKDVITGWGLQFSNKLVPIHLQGFQYPYYQHVGCDDVNMFLSIKSNQAGRDIGLKEQLSMLNERLQTTTKIITYNSPELITHLDPRLEIDVPGNSLGHIFNVFGVKKVVYNGSNISSVEGKPGLWSINLNLTQANFTLKDYQSIIVKNNISGVEDDIANLLLRSRITNNGDIEVVDYVVNTTRIGDLNSITESEVQQFAKMFFGDIANSFIVTGSSTNDIPNELIIGSPETTNIFGTGSTLAPVQIRQVNNFIMTITFYKRFATEAYREWRNSQTEESLKQELNEDGTPKGQTKNQKIGKGLEYVNLLFDNTFTANGKSGLIEEVVNRSDTERLRRNLSELNMKLIYQGIIDNIDNLHEQHSGILIKGVRRVRGLWEIIDYDLKNNSFGLYCASLFAVAAGIQCGFGILLWSLTAGILGLLGGAGSFAKKGSEELLSAGLSQLQEALPSLMTGIKSSVVKQMVTDIMRDPVIRKRFFGEKYEKVVSEIYNKDGMNCYEDFDIPENYLAYNVGSTAIDLKFSPDFYMYNKDISGLEKYKYMQDFTDISFRMARTAAMLAVEENKEVLEKLENVEDMIFSTSVDDVTFKNNWYNNDLKLTKQGNSKAYPSIEEGSIAYKLEELKDIYRQLATNKSSSEINPDALKLNLMRSARNKRILELKVIQTAINLAMAGEKINNEFEDVFAGTTSPAYKDANSLINKVKNKKLKNKGLLNKNKLRTSLEGASKGELERLSGLIAEYIKSYNGKSTVDTTKFKNSNKDKGIRLFEETVYVLITQIIILSDAIAAFQSGEINITSMLQSIPEMQLLDWYNWRNIDDMSSKKIELMTSILEEDANKSRGHNQRMFPTFKLFFVEEDGKTIRNVDDYYSYNAIQSIDIVKNKYASSTTAVVTLGNVYGNLTNKLSLMRESQTVLDRLINNRDNRLFLGSLDIKPGVKIIIKMGYGANDKDLSTVFVGRVIEMSPGPVTQLIAQSYGSQLTHEISKMHFGLTSTNKEHGDIASAILDAAPSLEGLGKPSLLGLNPTRFTGRKSMLFDGKFFDRFLMSNITTRVNYKLLTEENPRDENIYLPYDLAPDLTENLTFDWIVYNQSIWQALHEITLYHNNTFPIIRPYNNGDFSTLDDIRETIVIGKKSGYYKHTDAFRYTSQKVDDISKKIEDWNRFYWKFIQSMANIINVQDGNTDNVNIYNASELNPTADILHRLDIHGYVSKEITEIRTSVNSTHFKVKYYPRGKLLNLMQLMTDRQFALIMSKALDATVKLKDPLGTDTVAVLIDVFQQLTPGIFDNAPARFRRHLIELSSKESPSDAMGENAVIAETEGIVLNIAPGEIAKWVDEHTRLPFIDTDGPGDPSISTNILYKHPVFDIIHDFRTLDRYIIDGIRDLKPYQFLDVEEKEIDNTKRMFVNDPRYKKIQQHHLITDTSDIISNNLVLSEDFHNAVSVYYLPEPEFYSSLGGISPDDADDLSYDTLKAFGDTRDSDIRLLETYQKNIDINFCETRVYNENTLGKYRDAQNNKKLDNYKKVYSRKGKDVPVIGFNDLPSYKKVGISLLMREAEKMYRGTITIVGNPRIEAMDIVHMDDNINTMKGPIEIEEVVHSFSPTNGFTTTLTPSLITYDRDPIALSDVETVSKILTTAEIKRSSIRTFALSRFALAGIATAIATADIFLGSKVIGGLTAIGSVPTAAVALYDATSGAEKRYNKFIFDSMANVFGRDCINFSALLYKDKPYMTGFGGVDYTNIKTIINHQWQGQNVITRLATSNDVERYWLETGGRFEKVEAIKELVKSDVPFLGGTLHLLMRLFDDDQFGEY